MTTPSKPRIRRVRVGNAIIWGVFRTPTSHRPLAMAFYLSRLAHAWRPGGPLGTKRAKP